MVQQEDDKETIERLRRRLDGVLKEVTELRDILVEGFVHPPEPVRETSILTRVIADGRGFARHCPQARCRRAAHCLADLAGGDPACSALWSDVEVDRLGYAKVGVMTAWVSSVRAVDAARDRLGLPPLAAARKSGAGWNGGPDRPLPSRRRGGAKRKQGDHHDQRSGPGLEADGEDRLLHARNP